MSKSLGRSRDVSLDSEAGAGSYSERIDVIFLAAEVPSSPPGPTTQRGRPKACIALHFDPDWTPQDDGTRELLGFLGVSVPIPVNFDWEKELANRRIVGRFDPSPRRQTQDDHDSRFLEALGLPPILDLSVDLEKELTGQWIKGRPGPPGPDGFNPLEEFKAIPSPVPAVFHPASPASGVASTLAVSLADSLASAECPSMQGTAGTMRDFSSVHESISSEASNCTKLLSELERLPDRIVEKIQPLIVSGVSNCVDDMTDRPSRAAETAYRAYQCAEEKLGTRIGDKDAYEWLRENGPLEYTLPPYENWARYLRQARQHYGDQKHRPRKGRTGRSIVHLSEI